MMPDGRSVAPASGERRWNVCVQHGPRWAGLSRAIDDFSRALDAGILSFERGEPAASPPDPGSRIHRIPCGRLPFLQDACLLSRATRKIAEEAAGDFDVLVVHSLFRGHAPWAGALANRHGRPHWTVPHGCLDPWGMARRTVMKQAWLRIHGRAVLDAARYVIFSSHREQEKASRWGARRNGVVVHWPTCPPPSNRAVLRSDFRSRRAIPPHARVLLFLGRLHSMKRVHETVAVFCRAAADNCHLVVAGPDGDISARAIRAAIPERWADKIHVVGPLAGADLDAARSAADGFISLSHRENFGYSAADALAWRQPVILSTGHDVVHEMPREKTGALACGWLIPDDFVGSATEAIRAFATLPERRLGEMADAGGAWADDQLSFDRFRAALLALLANS